MFFLTKFKKILKKRHEEKQFQKFLKKNTWNGLLPGDVVEYKDKKLMYRGINKNGGPGMPQIPEPVFGPIHPKGLKCIYYLRDNNQMFPESIFNEKEPAIKTGDTGIFVGFLNAIPSELIKIDHITPEQWKLLAST